jgi:hypothetical protein
MMQKGSYRSSVRALALVFAGALAWPAAGAAQTLSGQARAVQAMVALGTTTLADTGTLGGPTDTRDATLATGSVGSLLSGEVLRAVTVGWPDQVVSEASLANLTLTVGGTGISAGTILASVLAVPYAPATVSSTIGNLAINGVPVAVTGSPNQSISIPGGRLVINERIVSPASTTVNALHVTVFGVADVVIASATAGISGF